MHKGNKGMALILSIVVVTMVSVLLVSYVATVINEKKRIEHELSAGSAEYIAKAGLERTFLDLSCEHDRDEDWVDGGVDPNPQNEINGIAASVPTIGTGTEDPLNRSDYQDFHTAVNFPDVATPTGNYTVQIAFVNNAADSAFRENRLWVRSIGTVTATGDSVTLEQLATIQAVALVEVDGSGDLVEIERLYGTLDDPSDSLVDDAMAIAANHEIRIAGATLDEDVTIDPGGGTLIIKGGYGYDFTDGSRDTSAHISILEDSAGADTVVTISGSGTVEMGGVRIE